MGIVRKQGTVRRALPRISSDAVNPHVLARQDVRRLAADLPPDAARGLVDYYYQIQRDRLAMEGKLRATTLSSRQDTKGLRPGFSPAGEPNALVNHFTAQMFGLEQHIKAALDIYSQNQPLGRWARSIRGIGPVLSSGLLAHIRFQDDAGAPYETASSLWSFAGLDPTAEWGRGKKRPWNAKLKVLCWKIGESFVLQSGKLGNVYGEIYLNRKLLEGERNELFLYASQAEAALKAKEYGEDTVARRWYEQGKLPPAHIHARAQRYAVKLFLAHYHEVGYYLAFRRLPPFPYVFERLGHRDIIMAPHSDLIPGLADAQVAALTASGRLRGIAV